MLNDLHALTPASFFRLFVKIRKEGSRATYLPDVSGLLGEELFARISLLWSFKGMLLQIDIKTDLTRSFFPKYRRGDSLEFFFDTRQLKHTQSIHQFCHHFVFLPEEVDGVQAREVTRFRFQEERTLAQSHLFHLETKVKQKGYIINIHLPKESLHGYAPEEFKTLGFAYRINRLGGDPQQFPLSSKCFSLEKDPSLWATLLLN